MLHRFCLLVLRGLLTVGLVFGSWLAPLPTIQPALAASGDVTSTTVACGGLRVQTPSTATSCTATVANVSAGATRTPSGTVTWSIASGGGSLSATSCTLAGSGTVTSCSITYTTPSGAGVPVLKASYGGTTS